MSRVDVAVPVEPSTDYSPDTAGSFPDRPIALLAATDGRPQSDFALLAARRLAPERPLEVITVIPRSTAASTFECEADIGDTIAQRSRVEWQLRRVLGSHVKACVDVCTGDPPGALAKAAVDHEARLLVVGVGRPRVADRLLGDESALRVVRAARTPVLAIAPGRALPAQCVVVAVDFSATSYAAAALAVRLASPTAHVTLVHVTGRTGEIKWGSGASGFRGDVDLALANWCDQLARGFAGRMGAVVLQGDPATELVAFAANHGADLVAFGAHGHGPLSRSDIGSIAARLVRCANWSILVTPRCEEAGPPSIRPRSVPGTS